MKKTLRILPLLLLLLVAASCHKKQQKEDVTVPIVAADTTTEQTAWTPAFQSGRIRATVDINMGKEQLNCPVTISYIADSIVVFSVQPFAGLEAMRIEADKQEIRILDKMQKRCCTISYAQMSEAMGGEVFRFQSLEQVAETVLQEGEENKEYSFQQAGIAVKLIIQSIQKNGSVSAQRLNTEGYKQISISELIGQK